MAPLKRGRGSKAPKSPPKKRAVTPDTSDTDPELIDSSEPRWEPLKIRDHYYGKERQMTVSQQLMGSLDDSFASPTLQFLTKWKDTPTERWSHDRHDTWEPSDAFLDGSNVIIKYLDRHPELESNPQMLRFKLKRDERRRRRISHIQKDKMKAPVSDEEANDELQDAESDEEAASLVGIKSPAKKQKKTKAASPPLKRKPKKTPSIEPDLETGADADEESDSELPAPIDISGPANIPPKEKSSAQKKGADTKAEDEAQESAPEKRHMDEEENQQSEQQDKAEPDGHSDTDADFNLFDLAPQAPDTTIQSSVASSPQVQAAKPAPAHKKKRKAESPLFNEARSSAEEEERPSPKRTKLTVREGSSDEEGHASTTSSKDINAKAATSASSRKDTNGSAPPATEKERKQHLQKVVASNYLRASREPSSQKSSPEPKEIMRTWRQPFENGQPKQDEKTDRYLQELADLLVINKTPFVGEKNVRSHVKVNKMVTRFWGVRKRFKAVAEEQEPSTQAAGGAPTYLQRHITGRKAAIFALKRPVADQKHYEYDVAALQLLSLSSGAAEVGPLNAAMAEDASEIAVVFIHSSSLQRAGDKERLVEDQLLNKVRAESPDVRFVVVGTKYGGANGKEVAPVFEPIFDSRVAVTFTSDLILHHTGEWKERAYKCHEMWPTVQMWMHAGAQPKSAELPDGATLTVAEATSEYFSVKYINSSLDKALSAGLGHTLEEANAANFPAEDDLHESDEPPERALKQHEEAREVVKLAHALRIKYFKVHRWIVVGTSAELEKFKTEHSGYSVVEFVTLEGLDPILKKLDEDESPAALQS